MVTIPPSVPSPHVHCIRNGVEHFNLSKTEPLEAIGIYIGARSVQETGYATGA